MARKKNKRPNLPQETLERARAELRGDSNPIIAADLSEVDVPVIQKSKISVPPKPKRGSGAFTARRIPNIEELIGEYRYVLHDLRNLAILAGVLLVTIVVASLVLARPIG